MQTFAPIARSLVWYQQYLTALVGVSQFIQRALDDRLWTPCCLLSGAPFPHDALSDWTQLDIAGAVSAAARTFWENPPTSGADSEAWPDYVARAPGVGIEQRELDGLFAGTMGRSVTPAEPSASEPNLSSNGPPPVSTGTGLLPDPPAINASCSAHADHDAPSVPANAPISAGITHRVKTRRRDILSPVIDKAVQAAGSREFQAGCHPMRASTGRRSPSHCARRAC